MSSNQKKVQTCLPIENMSIANISKDFDTAIEGIAFSIDGSLLAAFSNDTLIIYDTMKAKKIKTLKNICSKISKLRFTRHNMYVLFTPKVAPFDIFIWSIYENKIVNRHKISETTEIKELYVSEKNDIFMAFTYNNVLIVYDFGNTKRRLITKIEYFESVSKLIGCLDITGSLIAIGCNYEHSNSRSLVNRIEISEIRRNRTNKILGFYITKESPIEELHIIKYRQILACLLENGKVILTDVNKGNTINIIHIPGIDRGPYPALAFSPDSQYMISGGIDNIIRIYEVETGKELDRLTGHVKPCTCIRFSPNYALIVSGGENLIWWVPKIWNSR